MAGVTIKKSNEALCTCSTICGASTQIFVFDVLTSFIIGLMTNPITAHIAPKILERDARVFLRLPATGHLLFSGRTWHLVQNESKAFEVSL